MKPSLFWILLTILAIPALSHAQSSGKGVTVTNTWEGDYNFYWSNYHNWSLGHVPLSSEDVVIPSTYTYYPYIHSSTSTYSAVCNNLTLQAGAKLVFNDGTLDCNGDVDIYGEIEVTNANATLTVSGYMLWGTGSSADFQEYFAMYHYGIDYIMNTDVVMADGQVFFYGSSHLIRSNDPDFTFNKIYIGNGSTVHVSLTSTQPFNVSDDFYIHTGCTYNGGDKDVHVGGNFYQNGIYTTSNGAVVMEGSGGRIYFNGTGYFGDLIISPPTGSIYLYTDITAMDLLIESGVLNSNGHDITIYKDWTNNVGAGGFIEGTNTVTFTNDTWESDILTDETFYNLVLNKATTSFSGFEIKTGLTVTVNNDFDIQDGTCEMDASASLVVGNDLTLADNTGLNANDGLCAVSVGGNWTNNNNTPATTTFGFYPGSNSTVTFNGSADQYMTNGYGMEEFANLVLDLSNDANFRPYDSVHVMSDFTILQGDWADASSGLVHYFEGDFTVTQGTGAGYLGSTGLTNTTVFIGTADQQISFDLAGADGSFGDVIVDKSTFSMARSSSGEEKTVNGGSIEDNTRSMTVTLQSNVGTFNGHSLTIEEGTVDLNGYRFMVVGDVNVTDGALLTVDEGAELMVGGGYDLRVYSGGILELLGAAGDEATVTGHSQNNYGFEIYSGGTIRAEHAILEYMDATAGVRCHAGSIIDPAHSFDNCTFRYATIGTGTLLTIDNSSAVVIDSANFPSINNDYNVTKNVNAGSVTLTHATGPFAGPNYEDDPYDRIDWAEYGHWDGSVSTDWNTAGNWAYDIVPDITVDVYIPPGCPNYPEVDENLGVNYSSASYIYNCNSLTIDGGAELSVVNGKSITTAGDMSVSGRLDIGNDLVCNSGCVLDLYDTISLGRSAGDVGAFLLKAAATFNQYSASKFFVEALAILNGSQYNGYSGSLYMYVDGTASSVQQIQVDDPDSYFSSLIIHASSNSYLFDCQADVVCNYLAVYGGLELNGYNLEAGNADILGDLTVAADTLAVTVNGPYFYTGSQLSQSGGLIDCSGNLKVFGGTFNITDGYIAVAGDFYDENDVFDVTGGAVIFDTPSTGHIYGSPDFYNLSITKSGGTVESGEEGAGANIHVKNNLSMITGTFELNSGTILDIDGNVYNNSAGIIDADDPYPVNIYVGERWIGRHTSLPSFLSGTGSTVTFDGTDGGEIQEIIEYNDFNTLVVDASSLYIRPGGYSGTDIRIICDTLEIDNGFFRVSGFRTQVNDRMDISGTLRLDSPNDTLMVHDIYWHPGSDDIVTMGKIFVTGNWIFENGTNANITTGNTVYFRNSSTGFIRCYDPDASFYNLDIDKSGGAVWIHTSTSQPVNVLGDMDVHSSSLFHVQVDTLHVAGSLDIASGATMRLYNIGFLELDSDFTLNGFLELDGGGDVLVHGLFEQATTGRIDMDAGSFIVDAPASTARAWQYLRGELNLSDGVFEIMHNHIWLYNTFTSSISGGTIRCGGTFLALEPGTFQPTGGTFKYTGDAGVSTYCNVGPNNWFHDLVIDGGTYGWSISGDGSIVVKNDLTIQSSQLVGSNDTIYIGGDWTNNAGLTGFSEGTGLVVFNGSSATVPQVVSGQMTFYDVMNMNVNSYIDLTSPTYILNDFDAAEGGSTCKILITTSSIVEVENLYLPQGEFVLGTAYPVVNVGTLYQGGTIEVMYGVLNIDDVFEPAIEGEYILHDGMINLTQDVSSYIDLEGDVTIYGGEFNVYGGSSKSYWPYTSSGHTLAMSGGTFNFADVGILLLNNNLSYNISGGTLKTVGDFTDYSGFSMFTPSGGQVLLYGDPYTYVGLEPGNYFHTLVIDKNGSMVQASKDITIHDELEVRNGTFDINNKMIHVGP